MLRLSNPTSYNNIEVLRKIAHRACSLRGRPRDRLEATFVEFNEAIFSHQPENASILRAQGPNYREEMKYFLTSPVHQYYITGTL